MRTITITLFLIATFATSAQTQKVDDSKSALGSSASGHKSANKDSRAETQIKAVLDITADGWNTGDLSKYLYAYVPEATEMLSTGPAGGVEVIEKTMREGFWKTGRPLQKLRYENIV